MDLYYGSNNTLATANWDIGCEMPEWLQDLNKKWNKKSENSFLILNDIYKDYGDTIDENYISKKVEEKQKITARAKEIARENNSVQGRREFLNECRCIINDNFPGITLDKEKMTSSVIYLYTKKDVISRTCPIAKRTHNSNTVYFCCNIISRCCFVQCFDENCRKQMIELNRGESLIKDILPGDFSRTAKKHARTGFAKDLSHIQPKNFCHTPIYIDVSEIFEIYNMHKFVSVEAKIDEKRPSFPGWQKTEYDESKYIDITKSNVAIVTGKNSNLCVVDIDIKDNGLEYFQKLCTKNYYNYTTETLAVLTPTNGIHLYYIYNKSLSKNSVRIKDENGDAIGLDIRSDAGCVIAPPSKYKWGSYQFISLKSPQEMPSFIRDLFI
ncbi:MAG: hypothetical protein CMB64_04010 [Euryarchaeota archaeon]|nr:hypothetical protein [Euryarchaeota archaeon]|tara:strand:- start:597 stop:1745 length:1149 start_codon:yes stop_codon:yes gene_type:complete